jgi:pyruvate/2-oxoglutarate dehydrogenase complex dihydrolipoamide dehydrogenase (E3) component
MQCDVIVIGSGQAGVPLAARFAGAGRSVAVFERSLLGGTCVNYGCTPSKTVIASARAAHVARTADAFGVRVGDVAVDLSAVVDRKEAIVTEWREGIAGRLEAAGDLLTLVRDHARFVGPRTVRAGDREYTAETVIVNTGARPVRPSVPGLDDVDWLDNADLLAVRSVPDHLLVLGGGYIGCELGQAYRRFGAAVTIVDHNDRLLTREDSEVSDAIQEVFRNEGIDLRLGAAVDGVTQDGDGIRLSVNGDELRGSHLLVATGRRPNTDDLGADVAGLDLDERGAIVIDDRYRTSVDGVYAVGDAAGGPQFTHASWDDHRILFDLLTRSGARTRADRVIPYAVFTDPQIGRVGLSEKSADATGADYEVASMPFRAISRAREAGREAGLVKVLVDPATERVLGATLVGAEAAELVHVFVALMSAGAPARAIVEAEAIHPTYAEGLQSVLMRLDRYAL